jgi:hypothetical protein
LSNHHRIRFRNRIVEGDNITVRQYYTSHEETCPVNGRSRKRLCRVTPAMNPSAENIRRVSGGVYAAV